VSGDRERLVEAMAKVIDEQVRQALRDYGISDETMRGDPELYPSSEMTAETALAAIEAAGHVVERGWQPIETAEPDVKLQLGWWSEGEWVTDIDRAVWSWHRDGVTSYSPHWAATHWRPLPAAPGGAEP
jgi:hypothetical protein